MPYGQAEGLSARCGTPRVDNPELREHLLDVALKSFAAAGVTATSVRSIAADAGVNAALLSYYFGSKAEVVEAVFDERIAPVLSQFFLHLFGVEGDIQQFAAAFVTGIGELVEAHPWYPALWVRKSSARAVRCASWRWPDCRRQHHWSPRVLSTRSAMASSIPRSIPPRW